MLGNGYWNDFDHPGFRTCFPDRNRHAFGDGISHFGSLGAVLKFEPTLITDPMSFGQGLLTRDPGSGPLYILTQKIFDLMTEYVLLSIPLFIFMAALFERSGIAKDMYNSLDFWLNRVRGGVAVVTSIMAVIMAALSGIIGGEVVLLGLIALPQMLRLGYNQNLAVGTICASGSLGTMIPPSIVLIMYGLITETSIKALFTGAFVPGFMLASFFILYVLIRVNVNPKLAPLPEPSEQDMRGAQKVALFGAFLSLLLSGFATLLLLRALYLTITGFNDLSQGAEPVAWGMPEHIPVIGMFMAVGILLALFIFGRERSRLAWQHGKGLVAPFTVIGVVLGSIYGGVTGITEAAGMGVLAVFTIAVLRREATVDLLWHSLLRTLKSTGTIIWVTIGAATLAGAYTLAGGPELYCKLYCRLGNADDARAPDNDGYPALHGSLYGLGWNCSFDHSGFSANRAKTSD